ncbi:ferredoxin [Streptomyces boninensis]|uniref:ferredoxin n=1 Tax=Streptomyces boninensis TaxID=2039455 RepID=UPI003B21B8EE
MRISVDRDRCCGSGLCAWAVPELFDQSDADGTVVLLRPRPAAALHDAARSAADDCPCGAITVDDGDGTARA